MSGYINVTDGCHNGTRVYPYCHVGVDSVHIYQLQERYAKQYGTHIATDRDERPSFGFPYAIGLESDMEGKYGRGLFREHDGVSPAPTDAEGTQ